MPCRFIVNGETQFSLSVYININARALNLQCLENLFDVYDESCGPHKQVFQHDQQIFIKL